MISLLPFLLGAAIFSVIGSGNTNNSEDEPKSSMDDEGDNDNGALIDILGYAIDEGSDEISSQISDLSNEPFLGEEPVHLDRWERGNALKLGCCNYSNFGDDLPDPLESGETCIFSLSNEDRDLTTDDSRSEISLNPLYSSLLEDDLEGSCVQSSDSNSIYLGNGNDIHIGLNREATGNTDPALRPYAVYGGDGNDFIVGKVSEEHLQWAHGNDQGFVSFEHDVLDGGAGNDTLIGSHGDLLVGGPGEDVLEVVLNHGSGADLVRIADFVCGEDFLELRYGEGDGYEGSPEFFRTITHQDFIHTVSPIGDTIISDAAGQPILNIMGVENLVIGIAQWNGEAGMHDIVDLDGNLVSESSLDVLIREQRSMFGLV